MARNPTIDALFPRIMKLEEAMRKSCYLFIM